MYDAQIITTNQNSVKNTTAEFFFRYAKFCITFCNTFIFCNMFYNTFIFCNTFYNTWFFLQYFLQYLKKFAILLVILENFAISIAILRDFATLITILCDVAIPKYCNTLQYLLQYFTIGTTPAYHGTNSTKIINDYVSFARFVFNQSQSLFRKTRVYYELTESSLVSDGN